MKKNSQRKVKNLRLNRETLVRLESEDLRKAEGAALAINCTGCDSGCGIFTEA